MPDPMRVVSIVATVFFIIVFLICLIHAVAPRWYWKTFESWKAKEEPSKAYFVSIRIAGIAGMIIVAAAALAPTIIYYLKR